MQFVVQSWMCCVKRAFRVFKMMHYAVESAGVQTPNQMKTPSTHKTEGEHQKIQIVAALIFIMLLI